MDLRKPTRLSGNSGRRFTRPSLQGAKRLGSSVKSALGNTGASFRHHRQADAPHDSDEDSCFFHDPDEAVRQTAMEMFWSQNLQQIKVGNSVDDEDLSSTGFSDSLSDHSALMKSAHTTKTAAVSSSKKTDLDTTTRSNVSAKTLDPSDLRGGTNKKKKNGKAIKRIDFTGNICDSDDEDDDEDTHSRKSKSSKGKKNKSKKSKKKKSTSKKKKKSNSLRVSIAAVSDDDAVVGSSFDGSNSGPMVSGDIILPEDGTMISKETKGQEDSVTDLVTVPKPVMMRRSTTTGTTTSVISADPSISHVMERIALEDEKYGDRKVQQKLEQEVEDLLDENDDLQAELDRESRRNRKLQLELSRMETKLQSAQLEAPEQDDMEILHEEIQRLQDELVQERRASEQHSKESRSEIIVLQQAVDSLREEVSMASNSFRSINNSGLSASINSSLNASTHSENGKSVDRLQGELLVANGKIEKMEKVYKEQHDEVRKLRYLLDKFKENTGVKELEEKLEAAEKETARLRLELENVEKDWEEKLRSKEETIEFFLKELSDLKLQATGSSSRSMSRGYSRTLSRAEMKDVLRVGPEELAASPQQKRFAWLRRERRQQE